MVVVTVSALCAADVVATSRFFRGGPFSQHLPRSWAVLCSAPLKRVVRAHFLYFRGFFCRRSFPCLLSDPPAFYVGGGGGELNWVFLFSFNLRKWPLSNVVYSAKKVLSLMRAIVGRVQSSWSPTPMYTHYMDVSLCFLLASDVLVSFSNFDSGIFRVSVRINDCVVYLLICLYGINFAFCIGRTRISQFRHSCTVTDCKLALVGSHL